MYFRPEILLCLLKMATMSILEKNIVVVVMVMMMVACIHHHVIDPVLGNTRRRHGLNISRFLFVGVNSATISISISVQTRCTCCVTGKLDSSRNIAEKLNILK